MIMMTEISLLDPLSDVILQYFRVLQGREKNYSARDTVEIKCQTTLHKLFSKIGAVAAS